MVDGFVRTQEVKMTCHASQTFGYGMYWKIWLRLSNRSVL